MSEDGGEDAPPLALSTKVEEEFVSPLTAIRGALEILRDFDDLTDAERRRFVSGALEECARLEVGIDGLAVAVYAAVAPTDDLPKPEPSAFANRIRFYPEEDFADLDLSGIVFENAQAVAEFFDIIHRLVDETGRKWFFLVNHQDCQVWPEAWVSFAHRTKKVTVNYGLGSIRYENQASDRYPDRVEALARLKAMKPA
ncbi:MAG: hypothetical protein AAGC81_16955 [Pseudomonadota bacterium]